MALSCLVLPLFAQHRITGKVTDNEGAPVPGVAIFVSGTSTATSTDLNGSYAIQAKDSDVLQFSCIGFEELSVPVAKRAVINVTLAESYESLDDVVVTGYQTISKERATGSFDIVNRAQIEKPAADISGRLIGAAPGLAYSQDIYGNPTFQIRGLSTFALSSPPLIVIDGFPVEATFDSINPNDVENITILKDAAAASIWGAKSANGVIVITTKNAKAASGDKPVVNVEYSGFYRISPKLNLDYALSDASVDEIIDYEVNNFNKPWANGNIPDPDGAWGIANRTSVYRYLADAFNGVITQSEATSKIAALRNNNNLDQIRKYLLQNAATNQQSLNINIGTKRSRTAISLLYQKDDMIYKDRDSRKFGVGLRNKTTLFKWLDLSLGGQFNYTKRNNSGFGLSRNTSMGVIRLAPYEMLVDGNGDYVRYWDFYYEPYIKKNVPEGAFPYSDWTLNPIEEQENRSLTSTSMLARVNGGLTFKIIDGLTLDAKAQYELIHGRTHDYYGEKTYEVRSMVNEAASWNHATGEVIPILPPGGFLDQNQSQTGILTLRTQLNFNRTFAERHSIAAIAGIETIDNVYQYWGYPRTYGYNDETLTVGDLVYGYGGAEEQQILDWQGSPEAFDHLNDFKYMTDRYFSAFANASYTFDEKYTLSGSVRTDASNLITDDPKYRYAPFWSVGASWQAGKEEFFRNTPFDVLTLRATYGHNGNVDKSTTFQPLLQPYPTPSVITGEAQLGNENHQQMMSSYGNPTLRWERTRTFDVGVDFDLWRGLLRGKVDVYKRHSLDLIASMSLPKVMGTGSIQLNNGEITNKGIEFEIGSTVPIRGRDIVWDGTLMFSFNKNNILHLAKKPSNAYYLVYYKNSNPSAYASYNWLEGWDMNTLWTYQYGGIINNGTETSPDMQPTILGKDGTRQTMSAWPQGDAENISYAMGTTVAPVNASFSTSLKLYDFDLSLILSGKFGHKFLRQSFNYPVLDEGEIPNSKLSEIVNCDPQEMIPLPLNDNDAGFDFWDRFYPYMSYLATNASLIRVQEVNVAYNLPKVATDWLGVGALKFYVQANNPFNIYFNKWKEDPEFKRGSIPLQAYYLFGVKCNF